MNEKKEMRCTPAVLAAMARGDIENAIIAATPGGIEAQEARGQQDFVANETLPCKPSGYGTDETEMRQKLESLGIEFIDRADDLFWNVRLPDGWHKEPTDHSMWSHLLDEKGRKRASIFYKAAFYDRRASINLTRRYSFQTMPVDGWTAVRDGDTMWHCAVTDCDKTIWNSWPIGPEPENPSREWWDAKDNLGKEGRNWLNEHYPDWENPTAYWD